MKNLILAAGCLTLAAMNLLGQGAIQLINLTAPTRLGSIDGPLAGTNILAQFLGGRTSDSLVPLGNVMKHYSFNGVNTGLVLGGCIMVPDIPCGELGYFQMVAWDGIVWGSSLGGVPADQLGRTDIVPVMATCGPGPCPQPHFTLPAIVPSVPEPSVLALAVFAGALLLFGLRLHRPQRPPS